jgi:hypothetical protein
MTAQSSGEFFQAEIKSMNSESKTLPKDITLEDNTSRENVKINEKETLEVEEIFVYVSNMLR